MTPPTATSAPPADPARPEVVTRGIGRRRPAWIELATSADHKAVATLYIATSLSLLAVAAVEFVLIRVQLIVPENTMIAPELFSRLLSASGVTMAVLVCVPLALGIVGYVVPLQLGARGVALPRLGQVSYWLYLAGALAVYASFLFTPPEAGLRAVVPLADTTFSPTNGVDAWVLGVGLATLGFICFAVNLVATVHNMRAPGLAWRRVPPFAWAGTVISYVLLVIGPVMLAALTMLTIDRNFDGVFFEAAEGGAPLLYEHLSWIYFTGIYAIVVLFWAGAVSEVLPALGRKPAFSHRAVAGSLIAIGALVPLAWMQNMYSAPIPEGFGYFAMIVALALAVPVGLLMFTWIATLWRGTLRLRAPLLFALAAISTTGIGLIAELVYSVVPVGWQLSHTAAAQSDTLYVIVGGAVLGGFAAMHYWLPKVTGRIVGEGAARISLVLILLGVHLYALPMFFAGLEGQPADVFRYVSGEGLGTLNLIASIGAFLLVTGVLLELGNLAYGYAHGVAAGHDPWGGTSLEWFALSPPPPHNFDAVPDVRSNEPLRDIREAIRRRTEAWRPPPTRTPQEREPDAT